MNVYELLPRTENGKVLLWYFFEYPLYLPEENPDEVEAHWFEFECEVPFEEELATYVSWTKKLEERGLKFDRLRNDEFQVQYLDWLYDENREKAKEAYERSKGKR